MTIFEKLWHIPGTQEIHAYAQGSDMPRAMHKTTRTLRRPETLPSSLPWGSAQAASKAYDKKKKQQCACLSIDSVLQHMHNVPLQRLGDSLIQSIEESLFNH